MILNSHRLAGRESEHSRTDGQLVEHFGSLRIAGRALRINYAYLARLRSGEKVNPTPAVLRKLGLRKVVTYAPLESARPALPA